MAFKFPNKNIGAIQKATSTLPIQQTSTAPINPMNPISAKASAVNTGMTGTPPKKILTTEELFGTSTPKKVLTTEELFGGQMKENKQPESFIDKLGKATSWAESIASGINKLTGTEGVIESIGMNILPMTNQARAYAWNKLQKGEITKEQWNKFEKGEFDPYAMKEKNIGQQLGSAVRAGASIAPLFMGGAGKLTTRLGIGAGIGGTIGAGSSIESGEELSQIAKDTLLGATVGAGTEGALYGLDKFVNWLSTQGSKAIYEKAIGVPKRISTAGRSPAEKMIEQGKIGTKESLLKNAEKIADISDKNITNIISDKKLSYIPHRTQEIKNTVKNKLMEKYSQTLGKEGVDKLVENLPIDALNKSDVISTEGLNNFRKQIGRKIGDTKWLQQQSSEITDALKEIYFTSSDIIKSLDDKLPQLFKDESSAITARNILNRSSATDISKLKILSEAIKLGGAGMYGMQQEDMGKGLLGYGLLSGISSTPVQTALAVGLRKGLSAPLSKIIGGGIRRTAIPTSAYQIGQIYEDANGNKAKWIGNGWQKI